MHKEGDRWGKTFNCFYHGTDKNPVLLVKYEDLKNDVVHEIKRMLDFLSYPYKGLLICIHRDHNACRCPQNHVLP